MASSQCCPHSIRAVATILEQETVVKTTDMVITNVMVQLNPIFECIDDMANKVHDSSVKTRSAADRLYKTGEEVMDEIQKATEEVKEELQKMTKTVKEEVSKITDGVRSAAVTMAASMQE